VNGDAVGYGVEVHMQRQGVLTVISGFAGAGKGTIVKALFKKYPEEYQLSISATTRSPRQGEQEGREYFFKTREAFEELIESNGLIEWAEYVGNYYGTPRYYVEQQLAAGNNVILEIERQGAFRVRELYPDSLLLFVTPPSVEILRERLAGRGTEPEKIVEKRMRKAAEESTYMKDYDCIIVNDELENAVEMVHSVIEAYRKDGSLKLDEICRPNGKFAESICASFSMD